MTNEYIDGGETITSVDERNEHRPPAPARPATTARRMLSDPEPSEGAACPLCGERLSSRVLLQAHSLRPHYRSNRTIGRSVRYSSA